MTRLHVVPLELAEANRVVAAIHRHHEPLPVHRFSLGVIDGAGMLHGAAICSRPAARVLSSRDVLEVARVATDGTPNACSALYGAAARMGRANGYLRAQTYILDSETGKSLIAAGWEFDGHTDPITETSHNWANRPGRTDHVHLYARKGRWIKRLNTRPDLVAFPAEVEASADPLFDFGEAS